MSTFSIESCNSNKRTTGGIRTSKFSVLTNVSKSAEITGVTVRLPKGESKEFPAGKGENGLLKAWDKAEAYISSILVGNKKPQNSLKTRKRKRKNI